MNDRSQEGRKALRVESRCLWLGRRPTAMVLVSPLAIEGPLCQALGIEAQWQKLRALQ